MTESYPMGPLSAPHIAATGSNPTRLPGEVSSRGSAYPSLDIGQLLDNGPWTVLQKMVVFIAALCSP